MPEAVVEKEVCGLCGVERRPGAAFCYNCGGALVEDRPLNNAAIPKPEDIPLDGDFVGTSAPELPVSVTAGVSEGDIQQIATTKEKRRQRRKKVKTKVVEVEWKEPESQGIGFLVWTIIFLIVCVTLVAVAMYIR
jgi:hypothetical protein